MYMIYHRKAEVKWLNNRIKERRKELKITQSELAERIGGVSRQYISLIEVNKGEIPSLVFANKISKALNCCVYGIFDLDGTGMYRCSCCSS